MKLEITDSNGNALKINDKIKAKHIYPQHYCPDPYCDYETFGNTDDDYCPKDGKELIYDIEVEGILFFDYKDYQFKVNRGYKPKQEQILRLSSLKKIKKVDK